MRTRSFAPELLVITALLTACSADSPTAPTVAAVALGQASVIRTVQMMDRCDPGTFNAVIGAGTCTRQDGGITFDQFISQLTRMHDAPTWRFAPANVVLSEGDVLTAVNVGGEAHTFTEVEEFGGGIVPILNQLTGNTTVAPECTALTGADFVPPGGSTSETVGEPGIERYMCCIHPWMRAVVQVRERR
jgi:plastocyanin